MAKHHTDREMNEPTNSNTLLDPRPVAVKSDIHIVLFIPDALDFWVANADGVNVASHTRYTLYNLAALLQPETQ